MIEYQLKDAEGTTYSLNGDSVTVALKKSVTFSKDSFSIDNKVAERSFTPGSVLIGNSRFKQRVLTLMLSRTNNDMDTFRSELNDFLYFVSKTRYIVDVTNNMQIEVVPESIDIDYEDGALKKLSENEINFVVLTPFWESLIEEEYTGTAAADSTEEVSISNSGFFEAPLKITLEASSQVSSIQIYLVDANTGITVEDALFGSVGYDTMIIDCKLGKASIGELNRNLSILDGTGFFSIPVGSDTLRIIPTEELDYTINFKKRFFV